MVLWQDGGRTCWCSLPWLLSSEEIWLLLQPQRVIKAWGRFIGVKLAALGGWLGHVQLSGKLRDWVCSTSQPDVRILAANGRMCSCASGCTMGFAKHHKMLIPP